MNIPNVTCRCGSTDFKEDTDRIFKNGKQTDDYNTKPPLVGGTTNFVFTGYYYVMCAACGKSHLPPVKWPEEVTMKVLYNNLRILLDGE